jgi:signal transduction histidine kinase
VSVGPVPSIASLVAQRGAAVLALTLGVVGLATGALLHLSARQALDQLLLAAAVGDAHPPVEAVWRAELDLAPVETWLVAVGDPRVPATLAAAARQSEEPLYADLGAIRLVLLAVEGGEEGDERRQRRRVGRTGVGDDEDDDSDDKSEDNRAADGAASRDGEVHLLVAAAAPRIPLRASVGPFALAYALVGALAALGASLALRGVVRGAFAPLERARREATDVVALGQGRRLTAAGPVEVHALLAAINALLDRLDLAYAAQGRFTAEAAHELRTPVAALLGELEVALRHPRPAADYQAVLASAHEEVERLARLVAGLTALARLDAGQAEGSREPVRAGELVALALRGERALMEAAGCRVQVDLRADPELSGHVSLLEVALGNLLRNAAVYAPGRPVQVSVGQEGERVVFDVDDSGAGVPVGERESLFDRFARSGEARRLDRRGLGLGLAIARQVARRHGGDCVLLEAPGGGLRARLWLPLSGELAES